MYAYAQGDPVNYRDVRGLNPDDGDGDDGACLKDSTCGECLDPTGLIDQPGPDCAGGGGGGSAGGDGGMVSNPAGSGKVTAINNVQPFDSPIFSALAAALEDTSCGNWFQAGLTTSGMGTSPGESLSDFLNITMATITATGNFVGGNANAVQSNAFAPGDLIFINNTGGFFNALPAGQSILISQEYSAQIAAIQGGSQEAQVFILLHELGHLFKMTRSDEGNDTNQAYNNDEIWLNCSTIIQSFSN